jgi:hypothetical protein
MDFCIDAITIDNVKEIVSYMEYSDFIRFYEKTKDTITILNVNKAAEERFDLDVTVYELGEIFFNECHLTSAACIEGRLKKMIESGKEVLIFKSRDTSWA